MRRRLKQLIYLLFYALCWSVLIGGIYFLFLKPAPSCFDGKQNQGEEGIDCGGPCAQACIPQNIKPISVVDRVVALPVAPHRYAVFAQVKNENADFAAKNFSYTFALYNAAGAVVQTAQGNSFIYAGDVRYLFAPNVTAASDVVRATVQISNADWVKSADFTKPNLGVPQYETTQSGGNYSVDGRVVNNDVVPMPVVYVVAVFRGNLGQFGGVSQTEIDNLQPNETRNFSVLYPAVTEIDPNGTQVFVYAYHP